MCLRVYMTDDAPSLAMDDPPQLAMLCFCMQDDKTHLNFEIEHTSAGRKCFFLFFESHDINVISEYISVEFSGHHHRHQGGKQKKTFHCLIWQTLSKTILLFNYFLNFLLFLQIGISVLLWIWKYFELAVQKSNTLRLCFSRRKWLLISFLLIKIAYTHIENVTNFNPPFINYIIFKFLLNSTDSQPE